MDEENDCDGYSVAKVIYYLHCFGGKELAFLKFIRIIWIRPAIILLLMLPVKIPAAAAIL